MDERHPPRPDAIDAIRVLALAVLGVFGALYVSGRAGLPDWVQVISVEGILIGIPLVYAAVARLSLTSAFSLRLPSPRILFFVLVASFSSLWLLHGGLLLQDWICDRLGQREAAQESYRNLEEGVKDQIRHGTVYAVVFMVLMPALCEETLFRGIFMRGIQSSFRTGWALASSSALFAMMHLVWLKIPMMVVLGLFFGVLVILTRSLWASVGAHAVNNGTVLLVSHLESKGYVLSAKAGPWWVYVTSAAVFTGAMWVLKEFAPPPPATSR